MSVRGSVWIAAGVGFCGLTIAWTMYLRTVPPQASDLDRSAGARTRQILFEEIQPVALSNCTLERFGEARDGGYLVCANLLGGVEAGYSYGINGYDGWGCDISRRLNVKMHQYDCFNTSEPACPGGDPVFHAECLGPTRIDNGRLFDTLETQIAKNGDAAKHLIVKMDVEGAEWDTFLTARPSVFELIDQFVIEFHEVNDIRFIAAVRRLKQYFYVAHLHYNNFGCNPDLAPFPSSAYEALLVNKKIAVVDAGAKPVPSPLDMPNYDGPDCQAAKP